MTDSEAYIISQHVGRRHSLDNGLKNVRGQHRAPPRPAVHCASRALQGDTPSLRAANRVLVGQNKGRCKKRANYAGPLQTPPHSRRERRAGTQLTRWRRVSRGASEGSHTCPGGGGTHAAGASLVCKCGLPAWVQMPSAQIRPESMLTCPPCHCIHNWAAANGAIRHGAHTRGGVPDDDSNRQQPKTLASIKAAPRTSVPCRQAACEPLAARRRKACSNSTLLAALAAASHSSAGSHCRAATRPAKAVDSSRRPAMVLT